MLYPVLFLFKISMHVKDQKNVNYIDNIQLGKNPHSSTSTLTIKTKTLMIQKIMFYTVNDSVTCDQLRCQIELQNLDENI